MVRRERRGVSGVLDMETGKRPCSPYSPGSWGLNVFFLFLLTHLCVEGVEGHSVGQSHTPQEQGSHLVNFLAPHPDKGSGLSETKEPGYIVRTGFARDY